MSSRDHDPNPYAPPRSEGPGFPRSGGGGYQLVGDTLVVEKGVDLPDVCLFSGQAAGDARVRRKLQWAPPWLAILVALSPLIYIIVYYIVRQTGELGYALSPQARQRRTSGIVIAVAGSVLGFAALFAGATSGEPALMLFGLALFFVALIVGAVRATLFKIVKIDKTHIHLKLQPGATRAFGG